MTEKGFGVRIKNRIKRRKKEKNERIRKKSCREVEKERGFIFLVRKRVVYLLIGINSRQLETTDF